MKVTRDKIVYHNGVHSDARYKRSDPLDNDSEWLVFVPWDLDVESVEGIHSIKVPLKNGGENRAFLKEKLYTIGEGSYWSLYNLFNELEIVAPEDLEEAI